MSLGSYGSGIPRASQARQAAFSDRHRDLRMDAARECDDPGVRQVALAFAQAMRDVRPVVTLPPHIYMPWRGKPFYREDRRILDGTSGTNVAGATAAGNAEGIPVTSEASGFTALASFTVPNGHVGVLRRWAAQPDLLGYFTPAQDGVAQVRLRLALGSDVTLNLQSLMGLAGTLDSPFEVSYVVPEGLAIAVQGFSADTVSFHVAESFVEGFIVEVNEINETLSAMLGDRPARYER